MRRSVKEVVFSKKICYGLLLLVIFVLLMIVQIPVLTLKHFQGEQVLFSFYVKEGDEFTVKWIHSVELTPWEEIFRIDDQNEIVLDRTRFQQYGAGVPDECAGELCYEDGYIVYRNINQKIDSLPYGISDFAKHQFVFKDRTVNLYEIVPDGDRIYFYTEKMPLYKYLFKKIIN